MSVAPLNALNAREQSLLPTTNPTAPPGIRPISEMAWSRYALTMAACVTPEMSLRAGQWARTGSLDFLVNVQTAESFSPGPSLGVCVGPYEKNPEFEPESGSSSTIQGVSGVEDSGTWFGYRESDRHLFAIGDEAPDSLAEGLVGGAPVTASLADDPDVATVLDQLGTAATVTMGTFLVIDRPPYGPAGDRAAELITAAEQRSGTTLPRPRFAGVGWAPTLQGTDGITTFVTVYADDAAAEQAAAVISQVWSDPDRDERFFPGAATTVEGAAVITTVPTDGPNPYNLETLRILEYPGIAPRG
ncbi:hypothetical protein GIS00_23030 [Nakamurella sp. YIM 132087]|uniref:Uncharacterized protein n=1 Tax=Nakamurella alba TaxID=2665158 RepID=A0A7K1FRN4_9ACTN|nr:hypothetical protein [Nakamurella alba]MTD16811.1 hypothetical protein [Nakamurella alba]